MRLKVIEDADVVTYVVFCDPGDEAVAALEQFARAESVWKRGRSLPSAALSAPPSAGSTIWPRTLAASRLRSSARCCR